MKKPHFLHIYFYDNDNLNKLQHVEPLESQRQLVEVYREAWCECGKAIHITRHQLEKLHRNLPVGQKFGRSIRF